MPWTGTTVCSSEGEQDNDSDKSRSLQEDLWQKGLKYDTDYNSDFQISELCPKPRLLIPAADHK